jgi:hypothetical protein
MTDINNISSLTQSGSPKIYLLLKSITIPPAPVLAALIPLFNGNIAETLWNTADVTEHMATAIN